MTAFNDLAAVLNCQEVAWALDLDPRTVSNVIRDGEMPALYLDPEYRILKECVAVSRGTLNRADLWECELEAFWELGECLKTDETADLLQTSVGTVRKKLRRGVIPGRKIGQQWRIPRGELKEKLLTPISET